MLEVAHTCEDHRDAVFVAELDGIFVADGTAGLDDSYYACSLGSANTVVEREECVGSHNGAISLFACVTDSEVKRGDTVGLTGAYAYCSFILDEDDTVGLGMLNNLHTEAEVAHLFFGGSTFGNDLEVFFVEHFGIEFLNEQTACNVSSSYSTASCM